MNQPSGEKRAVVIGGSVAGLCAGRALRDLGWEVDVFERSTGTLADRGAGIVLQPGFVEFLRGWRQPLDLEPLSVVAGRRVWLGAGGEVLRAEERPQRHIGWDNLHRALLEGFEAPRYHRGARLARIETSGSEVRAAFDDGREHLAQLAIAADGSGSTVRRLLLPEVRPRFAGYVAWRGMVPEAALPGSVAAALRGLFAVHEAPGTQIVVYEVPGSDGSVEAGSRRLNWVWYRRVQAPRDLGWLLTDRNGVRQERSLPPGAARPEAIVDLREAAPSLPPQLAALVLATPEPFLQPINDLRSPRMVVGRACLLGDAAFVARPHTAFGTAKAGADVEALARAIAGAGGLDDALRGWERERVAEGNRLVDLGARLGAGLAEGAERS